MYQKNRLHVQAHLKALTRVESIPSSIGELQYRFKSRQSIRALFRWKLPLNWLLPNTRASVGKNRTGRIRIIASRAKTGHKKKNNRTSGQSKWPEVGYVTRHQWFVGCQRIQKWPAISPFPGRSCLNSGGVSPQFLIFSDFIDFSWAMSIFSALAFALAWTSSTTFSCASLFSDEVCLAACSKPANFPLP